MEAVRTSDRLPSCPPSELPRSSIMQVGDLMAGSAARVDQEIVLGEASVLQVSLKWRDIVCLPGKNKVFTVRRQIYPNRVGGAMYSQASSTPLFGVSC